MNKLFIDEASAFALDKWRLLNPGFVIAAPLYFSKFEVIWPPEYERDFPFIAYVEKKKEYIRISFKDRQGVFTNVKLTPDGKGHDFGMYVSVKRQIVSEKATFDELIKELVLEVLTANAFLIYGNVFDEKFLKLRSRNDGDSKVIVFRELEGEIYAAETSGHKSPEGIFSVRGHFRKYRTGKVIWIDEYMKGIGRK
ncbi:hypothetical protein AALA24_13610 [Anaerovoracaceae bacterium 42-11]